MMFPLSFGPVLLSVVLMNSRISIATHDLLIFDVFALSPVIRTTEDLEQCYSKLRYFNNCENEKSSGYVEKTEAKVRFLYSHESDPA